jgi:3-oxoacyl-[acyl-carrier protein] reductase
MNLGIKGRVALVCGSSSGLGRAIAVRLAEEGVSVVLTGRDEERLRATAAEIRGREGTCEPVVADLLDQRSRERLVERGAAVLGPIDICILNTPGPPTGSFADHSLEAWRLAYRTILEPVVHLSQLLVQGMGQRRFGRLLAIASFSVRAPADALVLSSSMRAAVVGLMKAIANEYGPLGVTANSLLPGYFLTDRMRSVLSAQARGNGSTLAALEGSIPARRIGSPDECGAVAAFLVSQVAGYVNGAAFTLDGGLVPSIY